jgi:hypothetical protein
MKRDTCIKHEKTSNEMARAIVLTSCEETVKISPVDRCTCD